MKKILFFTDKISYSGASKILTWLVNTLNFPDAEITLATHFMDSDQRFINNDIHRKVYESKFKNKIIKRLDIFIQLQNDILTEKYDLCVGFLPIESFFLIISKFFHKHKVIVCERSDPYLEKNFLINLCRSFFRFADGAVFQTAEAMNYYPNNIQDVSVVIPNPAFKQKKILP